MLTPLPEDSLELEGIAGQWESRRLGDGDRFSNSLWKALVLCGDMLAKKDVFSNPCP